MDFTIKKYQKLIESVLNSDHQIITKEEYFNAPQKFNKFIILRHDVDERPINALKMAEVEAGFGVKATYYFRIVKISNNPDIIKKIANLGHEIGYHYEDLAITKGNVTKALHNFSENLSYFRSFYPVSTICMHGSSMSKYDNRDMWKEKPLEEFNIIGEPYINIDYTNILYVTDTARRWDGSRFSIRDFVKSKIKHNFQTTNDIVDAIDSNSIPDKMIIQSHTLWTDNKIEWVWLEFREKTRGYLKLIAIKLPFLRNMIYFVTKLYSR